MKLNPKICTIDKCQCGAEKYSDDIICDDCKARFSEEQNPDDAEEAYAIISR